MKPQIFSKDAESQLLTVQQEYKSRLHNSPSSIFTIGDVNNLLDQYTAQLHSKLVNLSCIYFDMNFESETKK